MEYEQRLRNRLDIRDRMVEAIRGQFPEKCAERDEAFREVLEFDKRTEILRLDREIEGCRDLLAHPTKYACQQRDWPEAMAFTQYCLNKAIARRAALLSRIANRS